MPDKVIEKSINQDYKYGFVTDIKEERIPPGLNKKMANVISKSKIN